jgi:hypothetical protein
MYDESMEKTIRIIKDYDLVELSLVDNPANQFANILSVEKVDGVDIIKGDTLDTEFENVFWDSNNGVVKVADTEVELSPIDGTPMKNIGFVEKNDNEKTEMIKFLVDSAKGINLSKMTKEASPMNETTEDVVKNDEVVEEVQVAPEADAEAVEKGYSEDKTVDEKSMDEEKTMDEKSMDEEEKKSDDMDEDEAMKSKEMDKSIEEEVSKSDEVVVAAVAEIKNSLASAFSDLSAVVKSLNDEIADLKKSLGMANAKLEDAEKDFNNIGKRIDAVEADTAFRKSGDLGEIVQEQPAKLVEKSLWGGRFLKTADLFN